MVLSAEETVSMETLKQKFREDLLKIQELALQAEHKRKMLRLDKLLEIAKAGGIGFVEK